MNVFVGGMNRHGEIVGSALNNYPISSNQGLITQLGSTQSRFLEIGDYTFFNGINNRGQAVGDYKREWAPDESYHGVVFNTVSGYGNTLDVPGAAETFLTAVNDAGQATGTYLDATGTYHGVVISGLKPNY